MIQATPSSAADTVSAARMLRARVEFLVATLPLTTWINPSWAALSVLPFTGIFPLFGSVAPWRVFAAIALHIVNSLIAVRISSDYRRNPSGDGIWLNRIIALQLLIGSSWGFFVWLLWVSGNPVNNVLVIVPVVAVLWVYAFSRSMHFTVLLAVMTPTALLAIARFIYHGDQIAVPLALIVTVTYLYSVALAHIARLRYDAMLRTKFANDDLAVELRGARDEALRKRFEAEAANASKTTFLANMSHELRTPLNAILGFSEIIANETLGPVGTVRYREYAADINTSGVHLLSLINDILDIAKIESGKMELEPQLIHPKSVIEQAMLVVLARATEKKQTVRADIDEHAPDLMADKRALKQIVINLLSNAVKFTQVGGTIIVHGHGKSDGGFELCVEDNGPGIPPGLLDLVFVPFNQIDNRYSRQEGGTGLGLSLVRGLAVLHGGKAWIESQPGQGVRAYVQFPATELRAVVPAEKQRLRA